MPTETHAAPDLFSRLSTRIGDLTYCHEDQCELIRDDCRELLLEIEQQMQTVHATIAAEIRALPLDDLKDYPRSLVQGVREAVARAVETGGERDA